MEKIKNYLIIKLGGVTKLSHEQLQFEYHEYRKFQEQAYAENKYSGVQCYRQESKFKLNKNK